MSLTNSQLERLAKYLKIPLVSVCYKDQLPNKPIIGNYIINLASSYDGSNGTHWTCLTIDKGGNIFYFDSFGCPPPKEVLNFIFLFHRNYGYNRIDIQNLNSHYCGFFCLGILKSICSKSIGTIYDKANEFIDLFLPTTTTNNDEVLRNYFKKYKSFPVFKEIMFYK